MTRTLTPSDAALAAVAWVVGAATLCVELLLPRLLAPGLGTSSIVWTSTIAVVLGGIAMGDAVGGRLADRFPGRRTEGVLLLLGGLLVAGIPTLALAIGPTFKDAPLEVRAVLLLCGSALPASILLGAISTVLAREALATARGAPGRALGRVASAGAIGSLVGTYGTGFLLIPAVPTATALTGTGLLLAALGALRAILPTARSEGAGVERPEREDARAKIGQPIIESDEFQVTKGLCRQYRLPFVDISRTKIPPEVANLVPKQIVQDFGVVPIQVQEGKLLLATDDPMVELVADDLRRALNKELIFALTPPSILKNVRAETYGIGERPHASAATIGQAAPKDIPDPQAPDVTATAPLSRARAWTLAVLSGAALLALEVVAGRVAARLLGQSLYTWTAVLGAVLLGLALGAHLGGRWADRLAPRAVVAKALLFASLAAAASTWTPAILGWIASAPGPGFPWRVAVGALLSWGPVCVALGAIGPALVRAARGARGDGRTIGSLYAAQSVGAVAAALTTGSLLVPLLGPGGVTILCALVLALAVPLVGGRIERPFAGALAVLLLVATVPSPWARTAGQALALRTDAGALLVRESAYGQVRVDVPPEYAGLGRPNLRRLVLDGFVHGYTDLDDADWLGYGYEGLYAAVTERLARRDVPPRALFLGGGAATFPRWLARQRVGADIDVVEIDPAVTEVARDALGLRDPPFRVTHEDARTFVRDLLEGEVYDLVYGDAFADLSVPWHLATEEFAREIDTHLARDGAYLVNVVDSASSGRFLGALAVTLRRVFPHVTLLALDPASDRQETFVFVATRRPWNVAGLERPDPGTRTPGARRPIVVWSQADLDALVRRTDARPLVDAWAPVESLLAPVVRARTGR